MGGRLTTPLVALFLLVSGSSLATGTPGVRPHAQLHAQLMERWIPAAPPTVTEEQPPAPPIPGEAELETRALPSAAPSCPLVWSESQRFPDGFIALPRARTALRVMGVLKLDAIHDSGPYTGDYSDLPNLPLAGQTEAQQPSGFTRLHARESGLTVASFTDTGAGALVALLEMDFFGSGGFNTYGLRMSQAYVSWRHWLAGHTYSAFLDTDARGTTVEFNGPTAAGNRKRAQLRFTSRLGRAGLLVLALENGAADYTDPDGTRVVADDTLLGAGPRVVQRLPDLAGQVRLRGAAGHVALRAMARQLRVRGGAADAGAQELFGYGLALSGKWQPWGRSNLFAQATGGNGLGSYIDDLDGQAATFNRAGSRLSTQVGYGGLLGGEVHLAERWRANLIASLSGTKLAAEAPTGPDVPPLSTRFGQLFANVLYAPSAEMTVGLEYGYYRRETNTGQIGFSHRLQVGILYRFGI